MSCSTHANQCLFFSQYRLLPSVMNDHFGFWPEYDLKSGLENTYQWWSNERGLEKIQFIPGKLGHDVDLAYEEEVIKKCD